VAIRCWDLSTVSPVLDTTNTDMSSHDGWLSPTGEEMAEEGAALVPKSAWLKRPPTALDTSEATSDQSVMATPTRRARTPSRTPPSTSASHGGWQRTQNFRREEMRQPRTPPS